MAPAQQVPDSRWPSLRPDIADNDPRKEAYVALRPRHRHGRRAWQIIVAARATCCPAGFIAHRCLLGPQSRCGGHVPDNARRQAIADGYKDITELKEDTHLDALRSRLDFEGMLHYMEITAPGGGQHGDAGQVRSPGRPPRLDPVFRHARGAAGDVSVPGGDPTLPGPCRLPRRDGGPLTAQAGRLSHPRRAMPVHADLLRCVGPQRPGYLGLRAHVD